MIFPKLDFSNPDKIRNDLRGRLSLNDYDYSFGENAKHGNLSHGLAVVYNIARQKLGIVKEERPEIE